MQEGVVATSYAAGDKFYIDPMKLLPMELPAAAQGRAVARRCAARALPVCTVVMPMCTSCKVAQPASLHRSFAGQCSSVCGTALERSEQHAGVLYPPR